MLTFNTLEYVETLIASGVPSEQAKAQAIALSKISWSPDVATRTDIAELKTEFKTDMSNLKTEFKSDISDLKVELIKWVIGMGFSFTGIMFILLRLMLP